MLTPVLGSRFKRDVKRMESRGKPMSKLRALILLLIEESSLPESYRDHALSGNWKNFRDCHIEPDWLLIYKVDGSHLHLVRTGSHSDLFS